MRACVLAFCLLLVQAAWAGGENSPSEFSISYDAGTTDAAGQFMGGTETMNFASYDGKLYAGVGYWEDAPGNDPRSGAQILVRDA